MWTAGTPAPRGDAALDAMRARENGDGSSTEWVTVVSYENLPGSPRPPAALRA